MVCKYHISFSCLLLLLEIATHGSSEACWDGQYLDGEGVFATCEDCPRGEFQANAAQCSNTDCCQPCGLSTYQYYFDEIGPTTNLGCRRCPTRHQSEWTATDSNRDGPEDCNSCEFENSFMLMGQDMGLAGGKYWQCQPCTDHSTQDETIHNETPPWDGEGDYMIGGNQADNSMSCLCNAGFFKIEGLYFTHACSECPEGTYKDMISNTQTCQACDPGSFAPYTGMSTCELCLPGSFQTETGMSTCTLCEPGSFQPAKGFDVCTLCASGKFNNAEGADDCDMCPVASDSVAGSTRCVCDDNAVFSHGDGGQCNPCVAGKYKSSVGSMPADCTNCGVGKYSSEVGASTADTCIPCPAGTIASPGSEKLTDCTCNPGLFGPNGGPCTVCAPGNYKANPGDSTCRPCSQGKLPGLNEASVCSTHKTQLMVDDGVIFKVSILSGPDNMYWFQTLLHGASVRAILNYARSDWTIGSLVRMTAFPPLSTRLNPAVLYRVSNSAPGLWSPVNTNVLHTNNATRYVF